MNWLVRAGCGIRRIDSIARNPAKDKCPTCVSKETFGTDGLHMLVPLGVVIHSATSLPLIALVVGCTAQLSSIFSTKWQELAMSCNNGLRTNPREYHRTKIDFHSNEL